jgi:hypothetical protein
VIFFEKKKVQEGYQRHGRLPPQFFIKKEKYKRFGGTPPVPHIASHLLYCMADLGLKKTS